MRQNTLVEIIVGLFVIAGVLAFLFLVLRVSGFQRYAAGANYTVAADFDNVGDLKVRAPVTVAGVRIGEVTKINLDAETFRARVQLRIDAKQNKIPSDASASILTEGLLGSNYVSIAPGYVEEGEETYLKNGSTIEETHPALILEKLIGQFMFHLANGSKKEDKKKTSGDKS